MVVFAHSGVSVSITRSHHAHKGLLNHLGSDQHSFLSYTDVLLRCVAVLDARLCDLGGRDVEGPRDAEGDGGGYNALAVVTGSFPSSEEDLLSKAGVSPVAA